MSDRQRLGEVAMRIFRTGLAAVDPAAAVRRAVHLDGQQLELAGEEEPRPASRVDLSCFDRVLVVAAGKAATPMCQGLEAVLGDRISSGLAVTKDDHAGPTERIEIVEASHPVPDRRGVEAARAILAAVEQADERTLVVALLSGGGSALLTLPAPGVTLDDKRCVTDALLRSGAEIDELNAVRKHLSAIKGGRLAERACPATVWSLALSDVVGDRPDVIASGPTVGDPSSFAEACAVLRRRELWDRTPEAVRERLARGAAGELDETPKAGGPAFARTSYRIVGSNRIALRACAAAAAEAGFEPLVLSSSIAGEAREVARVYGAIGREIRGSGMPLPPPACVIAGGETTVTVRGAGRGGRNQELALAAALSIDGTTGIAVLSAGTDGTDGPTDAAGAIAYGDSVERAAALGAAAREHLQDNDAYPLFDRLGDLIRTGPTGTNVMDVHVVLIDDRAPHGVRCAAV